ncbi:CiaD-like domain-containing protein, partial [Helicobacter pylori]
MELKNIISETLNEIEKMAKTIDNGFDVVQKTPSFFKTPPYLQNT